MIIAEKARPAPDWQVSRWFNSSKALQVGDFAGKVIVLEAFQMLCPGCIYYGLPMAQKITSHFKPEDVAVIGLHTVFEHHHAMGPEALEVFLKEYRITFPVGVDEKGDDAMPRTMEAYHMQGTPSTILIDAQGRYRTRYFGAVEDMRIAADITKLIAERDAHLAMNEEDAFTSDAPELAEATSKQCTDEGCKLP